MDKEVGNFAIGKAFDALIVDMSCDPIDNYNIPGADSKDPTLRLLELVQKFVYVGDDRNIQNVFVDGVRVVA